MKKLIVATIIMLSVSGCASSLNNAWKTNPKYIAACRVAEAEYASYTKTHPGVSMQQWESTCLPDSLMQAYLAAGVEPPIEYYLKNISPDQFNQMVSQHQNLQMLQEMQWQTMIMMTPRMWR